MYLTDLTAHAKATLDDSRVGTNKKSGGNQQKRGQRGKKRMEWATWEEIATIAIFHGVDGWKSNEFWAAWCHNLDTLQVFSASKDTTKMSVPNREAAPVPPQDEEEVVVNLPILPPANRLAALGPTVPVVHQFPVISACSDKLFCCALDACRKELVGVIGTPVNLKTMVEENGDEVLLVPLSVFLCQNRIKPVACDVLLLQGLVMEAARRLSEGDMHAVNRRSYLTSHGVLTPLGGDVVPEAVRAEWVNA